MSDKSRPISFSVYGQLAAAEQEHANAVQATVSGIADETALHQWASCKAAAIRTGSSASADELRFILDVVDRAAVLRLPPDAAAALSWRCRTAAQNALAGPGAEDVRMLRACLAALGSVSDTPPTSTNAPPAGTQSNEGEKLLPDPFVGLLEFARTRLKGQERAVIEALCDAGGELPIADLAVEDGVSWDDPFQGFRNAQQRLNPKLKPLRWTLARQNNAAKLNPMKS
jgi:hypothetical protein